MTVELLTDFAGFITTGAVFIAPPFDSIVEAERVFTLFDSVDVLFVWELSFDIDDPVCVTGVIDVASFAIVFCETTAFGVILVGSVDDSVLSELDCCNAGADELVGPNTDGLFSLGWADVNFDFEAAEDDGDVDDDNVDVPLLVELAALFVFVEVVVVDGVLDKVSPLVLGLVVAAANVVMIPHDNFGQHLG